MKRNEPIFYKNQLTTHNLNRFRREVGDEDQENEPEGKKEIDNDSNMEESDQQNETNKTTETISSLTTISTNLKEKIKTNLISKKNRLKTNNEDTLKWLNNDSDKTIYEKFKELIDNS